MESSKTPAEAIDEELMLLDQVPVQLEGKILKPSQCYHFEKDPFHLLFNTNCPDALKEKVQSIVKKHVPAHEDRP